MLPVLLFGSESWALKATDAQSLERVHTQFLRQILNVRCVDRHRVEQIQARCGTVSLSNHLMAHRLRWLGHVLRMGDERCLKQVLLSVLHGVKARPGNQLLSWEACVHQDLSVLGLPSGMQELKALCAQRSAWRSMLYKLTH